MVKKMFLIVCIILLLSTSYAQFFEKIQNVSRVNSLEQPSQRKNKMTNMDKNIPITILDNHKLSSKEVTTLQTIIKDFKVNDSTRGSNYNPSIAIDNLGNFVIVWCDSRNGNFDIYAQRYDSNGNKIGTNFKVNDDTGNSDQDEPCIAQNGSGNFVIAWKDYRNSKHNPDIYAQKYNSHGNAIGTNFKVNDDTEFSWHEFPCITMNELGDFIIAWDDFRNGNFDIYAQRYNFDDSAQGTNFKVNDDTINSYQYKPCIALDSTGNFLIAWSDKRNENFDIYVQRYNSDGSAIGTNFKVNDDTGSSDQDIPCISISWDGNFVIAWRDERNSNPDIYAQRYNNNGSPKGMNFKVNDDTVNSYQYEPCIATDRDKNFVIAWRDYRNSDSDIYAQRYNSNGIRIEKNFRVTAIGYKSQFFPDIKLWNGRIYNTWTSNHVEGSEFNTWANVLDWNNPTSINDSKVSKSSFINEYQLMQNYPNPFNPSTTIRFALPIAGHVKLCIYNNLGQRVETLLNAFKPAGWHEVRFNAGHLASGVYYYKIQAYNFIQVKKMLLMR